MNKLIFLSFVSFLFSCSTAEERLPVLGDPILVGGDTVYPTIKDFAFMDQDSNLVTNNTFENKVYVTDFIFLNCPSICPKMNENMLNVYRKFESNNNVLFLSHTIDPERDSISVLKRYARNLNVSADKWHFVTGNRDSIYNMAENSYFAQAYKDSLAPGGYAHSGGLLLIDRNRRIRGVYDGTDAIETKRLVNDLHKLLKEQF